MRTARACRRGPRAGGDEDQSIDPRLDGFFGVANGCDVVNDEAAVSMHFVDDFTRRRAQARDQQRHVSIEADAHIGVEPCIGGMADLIDRIGANERARVPRSVVGERFIDLCEPIGEAGRWARVQSGESSHDSRLALREHQVGITRDQHRRGDHGNAERLRHRREHGGVLASDSEQCGSG